jgi:hypothetical protein
MIPVLEKQRFRSSIDEWSKPCSVCIRCFKGIVVVAIERNGCLVGRILESNIIRAALKPNQLLTLPTAEAEGFCSRSDSHHPALEPRRRPTEFQADEL